MIFDYEKIKESVKNGTDYCQIIRDYYEETPTYDYNRMLAYFLLCFTQRLNSNEEEALRNIMTEFEIRLEETKRGDITFYENPSSKKIIDAQMFVNKHKNIENLPRVMQTLVTRERYGNCHNLAIEFGAVWDEQSTIVTSLVLNANEFEHAEAIVHSYIVGGTEEETYVCDPTLNLVMSKKEYDDLFQTVELSKIEHNTLKNDFHYLMEQFGGEWNPKIYCLFPEEYMNEMREKKEMNHSR